MSAVVASALVFTGVGTGTAATASLTLNYSCPFPLIGSQNVVLRTNQTNLPDSAVVGQETPPSEVTSTLTLPAALTSALALMGAALVEGASTQQTSINNAGHIINTAPRLPVTTRNVPASGAFDITATGRTSAASFPNAGFTTIDIGNSAITLTPRKADGTTTGLGTFTSSCTLKAGQVTRLHQFTVSQTSNG
ncbi:DUF6801 domain-containing protein [Saccharothrix xinjiangensis]|uniref:DUF6801 domain-containing protein n=1 Tax=Saccharothrix xinjiangensis TaxID=204798 RepID=A0ABV9Y2D2_9PSEU